jgi:hypothetical protein
MNGMCLIAVALLYLADKTNILWPDYPNMGPHAYGADRQSLRFSLCVLD